MKWNFISEMLKWPLQPQSPPQRQRTKMAAFTTPDGGGMIYPSWILCLLSMPNLRYTSSWPCWMTVPTMLDYILVLSTSNTKCLFSKNYVCARGEMLAYLYSFAFGTSNSLLILPGKQHAGSSFLTIYKPLWRRPLNPLKILIKIL